MLPGVNDGRFGPGLALKGMIERRNFHEIRPRRCNEMNFNFLFGIHREIPFFFRKSKKRLSNLFLRYSASMNVLSSPNGQNVQII